ncbi:hypothetical protein [Variovorax sp. PAMC 28711]|uniref:hypothetical protein n=1 Tax=Variovorax sp. PAMC 28711 TaxID=1795631 RepID=UPI00078CA29C|nr:hypothetical protein [Variovorax sp. PAMC 28711]AMM24725.1 hypothetical protein AX767_10440 [Variovorax sp. PAMC 28711]
MKFHTRFASSILTTALLALSSVSSLAQAPTAADQSAPASRDSVRSEARAANRANAIPKGEVTTLVDKQPNAMAQPTGAMSRAQVKSDAKPVKRPFGNPGERPEVPTNPKDSTGTPK